MSSKRQGFLRNLDVPPGLFRLAINLWPPFRGAGIRVTRVSPDFREIDVRLRLRLFNRNYFGTQFGGSMFAMTDPFFALMMMRNLGRGYVVWDKSAAIRYVAPGRSDLFARFRLSQEAIDAARAATASGERYEPTFTVVVTDRDGRPIAEVDKTLYIRRHDRGSAPASADRQARAETVTS